MKNPPSWKLEKILKTLGSKITLQKVTETILASGSEFGDTKETTTNYSIYAEIQTITLEDMNYLPAGEVRTGDAWGFFLPKYQVEGLEVTVEVNDYIIFNEKKYLVVRLEDEYMSGQTVLRRAFLQRQVGQ